MKSKKSSEKKKGAKLLNKKTTRNKKTDLNNLDEQIQNDNKNLNLTKNKNEINLKTNNNNTILEFTTDPKKIKYSTPLIKNASNNYSYSGDVFLIFKSVNDIYYLIYENQSRSIIVYDIFHISKILEIKIMKIISYFNHYADHNNNRDLIMPIIDREKYINIYNLKDWSLIYKLNIDCNLHKACFYKDINNNELYIIIANYINDLNDLSLIQKYDLKGNKIKEIKESTEYISFLDCFYDKITNNNFILAAFPRYIKAYDFNNNSVYKVYEDKRKCEGNLLYRNIIINDYDKDIIKLIESCEDGYIRIWDFHKGKLIKRILVNNDIRNKGAFGLCLWNNNYLFAGISDDIVLVNINNEKKNVISKLNYTRNFMVFYAKNYINAIKKIKHPIFGECLLSKASKDENILLWTSNTINNILLNIIK